MYYVNFIYFAQVGDDVPNVDLFEGNPGNKVNTKEAFGKGKHVIFAIPGAFTPTCQNVSCDELVELFFYIKPFNKFELIPKHQIHLSIYAC